MRLHGVPLAYLAWVLYLLSPPQYRFSACSTQHTPTSKGNDTMNTLSKITLLAYFGLTMFALGKFTYWDADGYGFWIGGLGGYHVSTLGDS